jgi:phage shock protein PspC (stress-responsive transcriptional regulator)
MNKTININIGERSFSITEEAYNLLHTYITNIKEYFKATSPENFQEIVDDFEFRIAELFSELVNSSEDKVVTRFHVAQVMEQLGNVNDFADDEENNVHSDTTKTEKEIKVNYIPVKRLYRDVQHSLVGGVLAGLSAYMGIDKTWVRLIFVLVHFVPYLNYFPFILIYLIMWIIVPPARTVVQQMQMRGEDLSANDIARNIMNEDMQYNSGSKIVSRVLKVLFFILMCPIVFIFLLFLMATLGVLFLGAASATLFSPNTYSLLESFDEEVIFVFPIILITILLAITIVLVLIRLIFKSNVLRFAYISGALFLIIGGLFLFALHRMNSGKAIYMFNSQRKLVVNTGHSNIDTKNYDATYNVVAMDTVKFFVTSTQGYDQLYNHYSIKQNIDSVDSLLGGRPTTVLMSKLNTEGGGEFKQIFQAWERTDGWFGYLGAVDWKSSDAKICMKPNPDGTFEFIGCKPYTKVGIAPCVTLRYVNELTLKCFDVDVYVEVIP